MGIFAQKTCICKNCNKISEISSAVKIIDGYLCENCILDSGFDRHILKGMSISQIQENISDVNKRRKEIENFKATSTIGNFIAIDEVNREWIIPYNSRSVKNIPIKYKYDDIFSYQLLSDCKSEMKNLVGNIALGAILGEEKELYLTDVQQELQHS